MSPAQQTSKKERVLEQLRANMGAIAQPERFFTVIKATIMEGAQLINGEDLPKIAILETEDTFLRALSCGSDEHRLNVAIIGALRRPSGSEEWKSKAFQFEADILQALNDDRQLSGQALYSEKVNSTIADSDTQGNTTLVFVEVQAQIVYRTVASDVTSD